MLINLSIFLFFLINCSAQIGAEPVKEQASVGIKPKILVITCKGGGGHMSATRTLTHYLQKNYDVNSVVLLEEILGGIDPIKKITLNSVTCEDLYNYSLKKGWNFFINNIVAPWGAASIRATSGHIESIIFDYIKNAKPDLLISVMPFFNAALLGVAEKLQIPFLVITTDLDSSNYINGMSKPTYKKFYYSIPFDDSKIREKIKEAEIPDSQIRVLGFPVRPDFLEIKDRDSLKQDFGVPQGKFVVMLLMGAAGSKDLYNYLKALSKQPHPIHVIVCLGRAEKMRRKIRRLAIPKHISHSIIGFTDRISDLMAISDVLITKPGPNSLCEALYKNIPVIIDGTHSPLYWELFNIDFVRTHKVGDIVINYKELHDVLDKYITQNYGSTVRKHLAELQKPHFESKICEFVDSILRK